MLFTTTRLARQASPGARLSRTASRAARPDRSPAVAVVGTDDGFVDRATRAATAAGRVETPVRRSTVPPADPDDRAVRVGAIDVDPSAYVARVGGVQVALTVAEFRLLWKFARNVGRVLAPIQLTEGRVGRDGLPSEHAIRSRVFCLRRKLGRAAAQLQTVRGAGYRLVE